LNAEGRFSASHTGIGYMSDGPVFQPYILSSIFDGWYTSHRCRDFQAAHDFKQHTQFTATVFSNLITNLK